MDYLASFTLLPLRFAGNQLIENVASPDGITNRASLLYCLDIYKPESYQSGNFVKHESLRGREAPAYVAGGITFSEGCNFDLSKFVWGLLSPSPPKSSQKTITIQPLATMPYYTKSWVSPYQSTTETTSSIRYLLRAKLNEEQFAAWKESFFSVYLQEKRSFFTWQPNAPKKVDRNQPEFLSLLIHHSPAPTTLKVRVKIEYSDGTKHPETLTLNELLNVSNYALYTIPVGFQALELDEIESEQEKEIFAYTVWVSDQNTQQLTEERRYIVNNDYQPYVRHLVFLNSLGGWDTLRFFGVSNEQLNISSTTYQRQLEANYTPSSEELFVTNIRGERRITLNTGYLESVWLNYLEELLWSEKIYINSNEGLIAVLITQNNYDLPNDEEDLGGRTFIMRHSKTANAFSSLPVAPIANTIVRPTSWVGVGSFCLVNENGVRTGFQAFSMLELRYTDGLFERVPGITRKPNLPDTEGYIPALSTSSCTTTPFLNTIISSLCSYTKNDCGAGYSGQAPTITINAGSFGSETSQLEAQARAQAAFDALNTQAYANSAGTCQLLFQSPAISRLSTFNRNNCSGTDFGGKWTITVPAGTFTSSISQINADELASNYANSLDTQVNANLYGSCVPAQNYQVQVAAGKANFRCYTPPGFQYGLYYKIVTNIYSTVGDQQFSAPVPETIRLWRDNMPPEITVSWNVKIYRNGVLVFNQNQSNSGNVQVLVYSFFAGTLAEGDLIYIVFS